jgi:molybdate transport system permease protein
MGFRRKRPPSYQAPRRSLWTRAVHGVTWLAGMTMLLFLSVPLLALFQRATATNAWELLTSSIVFDAIRLSLITTTITLILTLIFGTPLAYALAMRRLPMHRFISVVVEMPIVLPPAVAGLALLIAFGRRGVLGGLLDDVGITLAFTTQAAILAQTFVAAPFYIRAAQLGFAAIPDEILDAARVDGADSGALFWRITLPLAGRTLAAGLALCWARAMGEFGATILFAGSLQGRTQTMPLLIYNILERDIDAAIAAGMLLVGLALAALLVARWLERDEKI